MRLELGKKVRSSDDEVVGELADIVVDPVEKRVTHLVVKPHHGAESHLVPVEQTVTGADAQEIGLRIDAEGVRQLPNVEHFAYLRLGEAPVDDPDWDVGVTDVLALPYYESAFGDYAGAIGDNVGVTYDRIPKGEVEVRRASPVLAADGRFVGEVDGFLVDGEGHITHFVLERGHLWGRREVTVPIGSVTRVESDAVTVGLSVDEIGELPSHRVHRWPFAGRD